MKRREFIKTTSGLLAGSIASGNCVSTFFTQNPMKKYSQYYGFNLVEKINNAHTKKFNERDFEIIADWKMNFVRIPLSYWNWASKNNWYSIDEKAFDDIDELIAFGKQYDIHINLSFHRAPGYCVSFRKEEPMDLFHDTPERMRKALDAVIYHWTYFAERYHGISSETLSFNLLNEPPSKINEDWYREIIDTLISAIRKIDSQRVIVIDGLNYSRTPLLGIAHTNVVQSVRGYHPIALTHFNANWIQNSERETLREPTWPLISDTGELWNKTKLREKFIEPYIPLMNEGVPIHVGEWGCINHTPHNVMLAWARDILSLWKDVGWGNALWNLKGAFGVLDSNRNDVVYENYKGYKLDRKLLELMKEFAVNS
jgi:endoglucanase